jgi:hypothetical protein
MNKDGELIKTTVDEFIRKRLKGEAILPLDDELDEKNPSEPGETIIK